MRPIAIIFSFSLCLFLCACGDRSEPAPAPTPPPAVPVPTVSVEEQQEQATVASSKGLFEYIPDDFTVVVGLRPRSLLGSSTGKEEVEEAGEVTAMLKRAGLDPEKVEQVFAGSKRDDDDVLVVLRVTGSLNEAAIKTKLGVSEPVETIGKEKVYALPKSGDPENGLCLLDNRTALLGRLKTVTRALKEKGDKESSHLRKAQKELAKASAPFWVCVSDGMAKAAMAESLVPGVEAKDFEAVDSFAMTISESPLAKEFGTSKTVEAVFTFERNSQATTFASALEQGLQAYRDLLDQQKEAVKAIKSRPKPPPVMEEEEKKGERRPAGPGMSQSEPVSVIEPADAGNASTSADAPMEPAGDSSNPPQNKPPGDKKDSNDTIKVFANIVRVRLNYEDGQMGPAISKAIGLARGGSPVDDGVFEGSLAPLASGFKDYWAKEKDPRGAHPPLQEVRSMLARYSWMCNLLPHLGRYDVYDRFDFAKDWTDESNFVLTRHRIPEFLNPAAQRDRWQGYPFHGMALTHFVGMAGVEEGRNDLAAEYSRDDPRAGIFGYDRILSPDEVPDGLGQTIMLIGSESLPGPWVQAGGSTVRGAREPYIDPQTGFHSAGVEGGGVYVLMADGSMRTITKNVDPKVFKAMCTAHGGDSVDLSTGSN